MKGKSNRTDEFKEVEGMADAFKAFVEWEGHSMMFSRLNKVYPTDPPKEIFELLRDWELKLRDFIDEKGMYMKKGEDAGSSMLK